MTATTISAPDVRRQARLALVLAVLGVPGSTIAWALPAGGFWVGVPLAVAAIVIGTRARSESGGAGRRIATAAIVLATAELLFMAVWTVGG
jgi:hypothetical protein